MPDHVYRIEEFVGTSPEGQDEAIRNAVRYAAQTRETIRWFEVKETRGQVQDGNVAHWQVTIRVGWTQRP